MTAGKLISFIILALVDITLIIDLFKLDWNKDNQEKIFATAFGFLATTFVILHIMGVIK